MNVGSIYKASHILGMLPSQRVQGEGAEMQGARDTDGDRDDAAGAGMQPVAAATVNMKGQQLGQILNARV